MMNKNEQAEFIRLIASEIDKKTIAIEDIRYDLDVNYSKYKTLGDEIMSLLDNKDGSLSIRLKIINLPTFIKMVEAIECGTEQDQSGTQSIEK